MRILVTNDDGIHSTGLWSAVEVLKDLGEVVVVAPDRDLSGMGSAISLTSVVRAREVPPMVDGIETFSVEGTPADCVVLATETLIEKPIDLLVSGINQGANLGLDIMISGTVGAAWQGYFRNIPSIAVSVASLVDVSYEAAALTTWALARSILRNPLSAPALLNVNLPNIPGDRIEGVEITSLGPRVYAESVERGGDGRRAHYWIRHDRRTNTQVSEGTDIWAVRNQRISMTLLEPTSTSPVAISGVDLLTAEVMAGLGSKRPC